MPEAASIVERLEKRTTGTITVPREAAIDAAQVVRSTEPKVRYRDLFRGGLAKTTVMMALLWFAWAYAQHSLMMWLPILLAKQLGYAVSFTLKLMTAGALIGILGPLAVGYTCDHWGRKVSVLYSLLLLPTAGYLIFALGKDHVLGAIMVFLMIVSLGMNAGALFSYTTEIFPTKVRATGTGFSYSMARVGGICGPAVGLVYPKLGVWWMLNINLGLIVLSLIVMMAVGFLTKRKTLEQIGGMTMGKAGA